jgi:SAM-dependent methyltransferase
MWRRPDVNERVKRALLRLPWAREVFAARALREENKLLREQARYDVMFWLDHVRWLSLLRDVQDEIAAAAPVPWYASERSGTNDDGTAYHFPSYRSSEFRQWLHLARWIDEDVRKAPVRRCLDVGSGYGTLSLFMQRLSGCESYLLDFIDVYMSPELVARHGFTFRVCNVEQEPLPFPGPFDAILFSEVLEHFNFHPVPTLRKIAAVLAPAGRLYLSTPDALFQGRITRYYASLDKMPPPGRNNPIDAHIYLYDEGELRGVLDAAGLAVERFDHAPGWGGYRHLNAVCVLK